MRISRELMAAGGNYNPIVTYRTSLQSVGSPTTLTATGVAIGTASASRLVIVIVGSRYSPSPIGVAGSVTVQGISATKQTQTGGVAPGLMTIWSVVVPTGTTADVVVNYSTAPNSGTAFSVYTIDGGASPTIKASAGALNSSSGSASVTTTMNVENKDIVFAVGVNDGTAVGVTIVGVTENFESTLLNNNRGMYAVGSARMTAAQTGRTFSLTFANTDRNAILVASFNK